MNRPVELEAELLRILSYEWQGRTSGSLVEEVQKPKTTVRDALMRLYREGKVERSDGGQWFLACTDRLVLEDLGPEEEEAEVSAAPMPELTEEDLLSQVTFVPAQELERDVSTGIIGKDVPAQELPHSPMLEALERMVDVSHQEPEVTLRFAAPTWVVKRVMDLLEQCAREGRG